jgi:hypothetical protein
MQIEQKEPVEVSDAYSIFIYAVRRESETHFKKERSATNFRQTMVLGSGSELAASSQV